MKIVRYLDASGQPAWGVLEDEIVFATDGTPFEDMTTTAAIAHIDEVSLLAPVDPKNVVCVGRNYRDHAEEFGNEVPTQPILFLKPSTSIIGPGAHIVYPSILQRVDAEAELVAVVGRTAHRVARREAMSVIGGFTCGNDVTGRDIQKSDPGGQWTRGKGFATFCPIGPWVDTAFDASNVEVACVVDGATRQRGRTEDFIFDLPYLIEYISQFMILDPGDIIMTGTPSGVQPIEVGNVVSVSVQGLGVLNNTVVAQT